MVGSEVDSVVGEVVSVAVVVEWDQGDKHTDHSVVTQDTIAPTVLDILVALLLIGTCILFFCRLIYISK